MKISVTVKPGSKFIGLEILEENKWVIKVKEPATEGKANHAVIDAISKELNIAKSKVVIKKGFKSKLKLVEILD